MNNTTTKGTFRNNLLTGLLTLLSAGVLAGCEYCGPILLVAITGAIFYRLARTVYGAMPIKPRNTQTL